jgi:pimeloyl-ACP methyl ester carboxylesterase
MPDLPCGDVRTIAATLRYYRAAGAGRPLLMLHGVTDNALCWTRTARALAPANDCILLDARAHGSSSAPASGYTAEDHAADVADVIRALDLNLPVLLGHSMGAARATRTSSEG